MNLKPLVNDNNLYSSLLEYFKGELDKTHREMEVAETEQERLRLQGQARFIRKMFTLKERVNDRQGQKAS